MPPEVPVNLHNHLGLDLQLHTDTIVPRICWEEVFGNANPVEVEIGSGRGRFLYEVAQRLPDANFVGIEHWKKRWSYTLERITKHALINVRVAYVDAIEFVETMLTDSSIRAFHIYFPDPWPKRRHQKRRIFRPDFVETLIRRLVNDGYLYVATDYEEYASLIEEMLNRCQRLSPVIPTPEPIARTGFEIKYRRQGRSIFRCTYKKVLER